MEYEDSHRKHSRKRKAKDGTTVFLPSLEDSLDRLLEQNQQFPCNEPTPEQVTVAQLEIERLHRCINLLEEGEWKLIQALFYQGMTEREYAKAMKVTQQTVSKHKQKVLQKLVKSMKL